MPRDFLNGLLGVGAFRPPPDWDEAARLVAFHGLEGLALARARESGGMALPPTLLSAWEPSYRLQALQAVLFLESASRAREALAGAGVPSLVFKGAALVADGTYPDPGARGMDDVDLLVKPEAAGRAVRALEAAGYTPVTPWSEARVGWADALTFHDRLSPPGVVLAVDLHWRTEYARLRFGGGGSALWDGADADAGVPAPEPHLALVGEHLLKHLRFKVHLAAFGDLARMALRVSDWDRVERLVSASRMEAGLRALLAVLVGELGAQVPPPLTRGAPPGLVRMLAPSKLAGRARQVQGRLQGIAYRWRLLGTPGRVAADLAEAAFPPAAWLEARYGRSGAASWGRYLADVARWATYRGRSPASPHQELFHPLARE